MTAAVRAGLFYFAGVFALAFLLGVVRILWLVPRLGETVAVLVELPVMLWAAWLWAGLLLRRLAVPRRAAPALVMGGTGFTLLIAAEFALGAATGTSPALQVAKWDTVSGALGLGAQILHAFFPLLRISLGRKTG
ncbi:hypothetical protein [Thermaurantiacus tibetensis]|uniref:hypothetical protein n=1 Tax=Thermaurantiacus tibetensis TaxID=2759035 RepID=UPI00188DE49D|nr:hypothetical protein [Thermaurantiacus tibetensis]